MKQEFKKVFSGFSLKLICLVTMITGMLLVQLNAPFYGTDLQTKKTETLLKLGYNLYYIGVPIACFLAAEAVVKTKNVGKLLLRLFIAAVVTEFVFDLAKYGNAMFDFSNGIFGNKAMTSPMNFFFTLFAGALCISLMEYVIAKRFKPATIMYNLVELLVLIFCVAIAYVLKFEHSGVGVFMIAAMYLFHENRFLTLIAIAAIQIVVLGSAAGMIMYTPVIGTLFTWFYSGEEGPNGTGVRLFVYGAFPVVYVILIRMAAGIAAK